MNPERTLHFSQYSSIYFVGMQTNCLSLKKIKKHNLQDWVAKNNFEIGLGILGYLGRILVGE